MIYFLLLIAALCLSAIILPIGFIVSLVYSIVIKQKISGYLYRLCVGIDQLGNVTCSEFFGLFLIKKNGYRFGNPDETISSVLGKNKTAGTLTWCGSALCFLLNKIEKNHVENSIDETV